VGADDLPPSLARDRRVAASPLIAVALVVPRLGEVLPAVSGGSLAPIARLLGTPAGATIAWAHFLAFDLLVGRWAYLDSREQGLSAWAMAPVLLLTFMLGPLGFLAYLAVRAGAGTLARAAPCLAELSWSALPRNRDPGGCARVATSPLGSRTAASTRPPRRTTTAPR